MLDLRVGSGVGGDSPGFQDPKPAPSKLQAALFHGLLRGERPRCFAQYSLPGLPLQARVGPLHELQLSQQVTKVFSMHAFAAAADGPLAVRRIEGGLVQH